MDTTRARHVASQATYHDALFARLHDWDAVWDAALDMAGDRPGATRLALDQLGHFGPFGVEMVIEQLAIHADRPPLHVVELGAGFGGALRHAARLFAGRGLHPCLTGVELVGEHCALALAIGRTTGEQGVCFVRADVAELPFRSAAVDAVFAAGSASHFPAMGQTLAECGRVLRPGGVLAMTEEVSIRPGGGAIPGTAFARCHPADVFHAATPGARRAELKAAGLTVVAFTSLVSWALPLLRQRAKALRLLGHCAQIVFGGAYETLVETIDSAADEYESGSVQPMLIVARRRMD